MTRSLNDYARKVGLLKDSDPNLSGDDVREGLTAVVSVKVLDPQFESQTKNKLNNAEVGPAVQTVVNAGLDQFLSENPTDGRRIIEKCLTAARAREAARKAREAKKSEPKPKKVFTNEDVVTTTAPEPPAPSNSAASQEATSTSPKPPAEVPDCAVAEKEDPNSERAWRKRFATQRRKITDAQQELDVLQREAEKADVQYYSDPQKALKEQYSREEINAKNDKIAAKKKELADLKQQLSDMEDELRRAGGDPGWAR